jgi:hypothetical protein
MGGLSKETPIIMMTVRAHTNYPPGGSAVIGPSTGAMGGTSNCSQWKKVSYENSSPFELTRQHLELWPGAAATAQGHCAAVRLQLIHCSLMLVLSEIQGRPALLCLQGCGCSDTAPSEQCKTQANPSTGGPADVSNDFCVNSTPCYHKRLVPAGLTMTA